MNKNVFRILKELGLLKLFTLVLLLRLPFDFLNAVLSANMIESFIRLSEVKESENIFSILFFSLIKYSFSYSNKYFYFVKSSATFLSF